MYIDTRTNFASAAMIIAVQTGITLFLNCNYFREIEYLNNG
jgi:hypothetical protein